MIVEYLIKIFLIVTMIIVVQTAYNTFVYRQIGKMKWLKFGFVSFLGLTIGIVLMVLVKEFIKFPFIRSVVGFIDTVIFAFFGYISSSFLLVWFVVPILIIWLVYLLKSLVAVVINRAKFNKWKNENKEEEPTEIVAEVIQEEHSPTSEESIEEEDSIHFLDGVPLTKIRFNSVLGLQRAYEIAKKKGLQISKTETGYIAVYANAEGVQQLKSVFNDNGIESAGLENRPSIIFFNKKVTGSISIKSAMDKVKAGESID